MRKRRFVAFFIVTLLVITSFMACGTKDDNSKSDTGKAKDAASQGGSKSTAQVQDVTLKVWAPQEEQVILKKMCENFAAAHPEYNITFEYGVVSEADASNELTKDVAAAADVFAFASDQTSNLVNAGILYPITYNVEQVKAANSEASIQAATVNGQLYAYPFTPNSWFMFYDKSKFTEKEVLSLETMMDKDLGADVKNFAIDINNGWYLSAFFFANGCQLFGPDGTDPTVVTFNNEQGVEVANYLIDLVKNPRFLDEDQSNTLTAMKNGKLAAWCSGTWNAEVVKEAFGDNYAATKLPTIRINGQDKQLSNFADFKLIGVNSQTKHPIPAMQLAEWLTNEENQKLRFEARSIAPTNLKLAQDPVVLANPAVAALSYQTSFSTLQSTIPQMSKYWTPAEAFGLEILNGKITKENVQEKLDALVESILSSIG